MKPEALLLFWIVLYLIGPLFSWFVGKAILRHVEVWLASRSESAARANLAYLYKALDNPPTLLESVAYIICFLPLPIALTMALASVYAFPIPPPPLPHLDPRIKQMTGETIASLLFFRNYALFSLPAVRGVQVAHQPRHGEARYADNYKTGNTETD